MISDIFLAEEQEDDDRAGEARFKQKQREDMEAAKQARKRPKVAIKHETSNSQIIEGRQTVTEDAKRSATPTSNMSSNSVAARNREEVHQLAKGLDQDVLSQAIYEEGVHYYLAIKGKRLDRARGRMLVETAAARGHKTATGWCLHRGWGGMTMDKSEAYKTWAAEGKNGCSFAQIHLAKEMGKRDAAWCIAAAKALKRHKAEENAKAALVAISKQGF
jgi:hypothetical protein